MKMKVFFIFLCFLLVGSAHQLFASAPGKGILEKTQLSGVQQQHIFTVMDAEDEDENEDENQTYLRKYRLQTAIAFPHAFIINDRITYTRHGAYLPNIASGIYIFQRSLKI